MARETGSSMASSRPTTAESCVGGSRSISSWACRFSLESCAIERPPRDRWTLMASSFDSTPKLLRNNFGTISAVWRCAFRAWRLPRLSFALGVYPGSCRGIPDGVTGRSDDPTHLLPISIPRHSPLLPAPRHELALSAAEGCCDSYQQPA